MSTKNIFISHVQEDEHGLSKLKSLIKEHGLACRDFSITSLNGNDAKNEDYIKRLIRSRIDQCSVVAIYISPKTVQSDWVNWEIEYALSQGKRIVGIWARGYNDCEVPDALEEHSDSVVGWNGTSIIDAIEGKNVWEAENGSKMPERVISRVRCQT